MRTGELAAEAGVDVQTLRHYERRGLVPARELAEEKLAELDRRIADLRAMRDSLQRLTATCARPRADRDRPLLQTIDHETTAA